MSNELINVEQSTVLKAFETDGGLDPMIQQARDLVNAFEPDLATDKGRKAIASLAAKVASFKVRIDGFGKDSIADKNAVIASVNKSRKKMRDELDELKIQARAPLTEWENKEKQRVQGHRESIDYIDGWVAQHNAQGEKLSLDDLELSLSHVQEVDTGELEEFELEGVKTKEKSITILTGWIDEEKKRLETEAELERLRQEEEKRKQQEHEEDLKREAAEAAKTEAEHKAKAERDKVEQEKREAIEREEKAKADAAESNRQRIVAEERAKLEKEQAEKNRIEAEEKAKRDKDLAAENARNEEARRQNEEERLEREETAKREANRTHVGKIRKQAKESLMRFTDEETAKKIVLAISGGEIANVNINY